MTAIMRGDLDRARALLAVRRDHSAEARLATLRIAGLLARAAGDHEALRAGVDEALEVGTDGGFDGLLWFILAEGVGAAADAAEAARRRRRLDDPDSAQADGHRWMDRLRSLANDANAFGGAGGLCAAALQTAEAELTRLVDVSNPVAWAQAADRWGTLRHAYWTAYTRLRLAEASLALGGERAAAMAALREAQAGAEGLGAAPMLKQIATIARHARIDLRAAPTADAAAQPAVHSPLTDRERDVLGMVAEGHTNREIGDSLFITEKTASVQVSNAMAKLGALSRYEAAATAERLGFLA